MEITRLEKAALITTGAAAAYKTLLWSLEASVDSTDPYLFWLRALFAFASFVAFDLVLMAVIGRGWSWHGALALVVASVVSGVIGLEVGRVVAWPALHAAPAITLGAFGLHLMLCRQPTPISQPPSPEPPTAFTQAVQVNVGQALPPNVAAYIAAKAAELPDTGPDELAQLIGVSARNVRSVLQITDQEVAS